MMKKLGIVVLSGVLLVTLVGCSPRPYVEPLPTIPPQPTATPSPYSTAAPTPAPSTVNYISPEEAAMLKSDLEVAGLELGVDVSGLGETAETLPIHYRVNDTRDSMMILYPKGSLTQEDVQQWFNQQDWSDGWVDYVPSGVDKIWGFSENSIGKEKDDLFLIFDTNGEETQITIYLSSREE